MSLTNANTNNAANTNISASINRNMDFNDIEKDFISEGGSKGCISQGYSSDIGSISSKKSTVAKKERKGSPVKGTIENKEDVCISLDLGHGEE